jgi:hypothetical protein
MRSGVTWQSDISSRTRETIGKRIIFRKSAVYGLSLSADYDLMWIPDAHATGTAPQESKQRSNNMNAQRKIQVVDTAAMLQDGLFRSMRSAPRSKLAAMQAAIAEVVSARTTFESKLERRAADGSYFTGQSNDIKHLQALQDNDSVTRLFVALKVDPVSYLFPQSQDHGKSSSETSNLKAYKKAREVAELIWTGVSKIENVCKVFTVCAFKSTEFGVDTLGREFAETFLSSRELRSVTQGSADLFDAIDEVKAKHMTTGAQTQTSQMVRTLVALKSAKDVRNGRSKDTWIDHDGRVMQALMRRFGVVTDVTIDVAAIDDANED